MKLHDYNHEQFATELVKPGDRIISFNYDVSLDSRPCRPAMWWPGDGYGFPVEGLPCGSAVSIIKLHGLTQEIACRLVRPADIEKDQSAPADQN